MNKNYSDYSLEEFTKALASKASIPSGGGASALAGAIGIALGSMVGELTIGKKKYAEVEEDMIRLTKRAEEMRRELVMLVDEDARGFFPLSRAYSIPRDNPDRDRIMEECLISAAKAPLRTLDLCVEACEMQREFRDKGSSLVVSDAATGAMILMAAACCAAANVRVNTRFMKNRDYAGNIDSYVTKQMHKCRLLADEIYNSVMQEFNEN